MNNTPNSGGRKKKVTQGSGKIGKGEQVNTHGPVGRQDGYQGRQDGNPKKPQSNPNNGSEGDKGLGTDILGAMLGGGSSQSSGGSVLGSILGGSSQGSQSSQNSGSGLLGGLLGGSAGSSQSSQQSSHSSQSSGGGLIGGLLGGSGSSSGKKGGGLSKILVLILLIVGAVILYKTCSGGGCSMGNIAGNAGDFTGGSTDFMQQMLPDFNAYSADDVSAPQAPAASTSTNIVNTSVSNNARNKYTTIKGDGTDKTTLMVFMCGTDLESKYGMGSNDLNEMLKATLNDNNLNIIVETGGTSQWKNSVMKPGTNQRWRIRQGGIEKLGNDLGQKSMVSASTLSDFIKFCKTNYPANRYMLIFWDHGGGSLTGYGYDPYAKGSMTLDQIDRALTDAGVKFDFIGFDACLMGTFETALVTEKHADYLIGSEETEPGCGWFYTTWLTRLCQNPGVSTVDLAKIIIDDFNDVCAKNNAGDTTTLSIVDLAEFAGTVPEPFRAFAQNVGSLLDSSEYQTVANARSGAREFGASAGIDHVDLIHFASRIGTAEANNLVNALKGCIKYNRASRAMTNSYGMSIYFPFKSVKSVNSAIGLYNTIGMDSAYSSCLRSFASLSAGGQIATGSVSSPMGSLFGNLTSGGSSSDLLGALLGGGGSSGGADLLSAILGGRSLSAPENEWFDSSRVLQNLDYYDAHAIYAEDMHITEKNGGWVLDFPDEKWELVETVQLNAFLDDGEGYIDLGMDNVYEFDPDGQLKIDFDGTWMALDGQVVPYYFISENHDGDYYTITGRVPALLNGELVDVIVVFDNETEENEYGYVAGARLVYDDEECATEARGLVKLKDGDKLEFLCDYYSYDQQYQASYKFGDPIVVKGDIEVSNVSLEGNKCLVTYCLTDMYSNEFWSEAKEF